MRAKGAKNTIQHKSGAKKVTAHGSDSCKDTVMARQLLRNLRQCPVTGGRSTAMTEEQFEAACEYHQERNGRARATTRPRCGCRLSTTGAPPAGARCGRASCASSPCANSSGPWPRG